MYGCLSLNRLLFRKLILEILNEKELMEVQVYHLYPEIRSSSVDFPAPDGPIIAINLLGANFPLISCSTFFLPKKKKINNKLLKVYDAIYKKVRTIYWAVENIFNILIHFFIAIPRKMFIRFFYKIHLFKNII